MMRTRRVERLRRGLARELERQWIALGSRRDRRRGERNRRRLAYELERQWIALGAPPRTLRGWIWFLCHWSILATWARRLRARLQRRQRLHERKHGEQQHRDP